MKTVKNVEIGQDSRSCCHKDGSRLFSNISWLTFVLIESKPNCEIQHYNKSKGGQRSCIWGISSTEKFYVKYSKACVFPVPVSLKNPQSWIIVQVLYFTDFFCRK